MSISHYTGLNGADDILDFAQAGAVARPPNLIMADGIQPVSPMGF